MEILTHIHTYTHTHTLIYTHKLSSRCTQPGERRQNHLGTGKARISPLSPTNRSRPYPYPYHTQHRCQSTCPSSQEASGGGGAEESNAHWKLPAGIVGGEWVYGMCMGKGGRIWI
ncbi:hypothetical protein EON63_24750 [archaeon]|nr:MAG: hypothetical protein EON63_24750 [archaeon]